MTTFPNRGCLHLRTGRYSLPGQLYLLTTVTHQRHPWFLDADIARLAARTMSSAAHWLPSRCLCWVLMPDHWHGLVELGEGAALATAMQRIKGAAAHSINQRLKIKGPIWASGFHDHALRREESVEDVVRYMMANPVRAGLVHNVIDYPYWDCPLNDEASTQALGGKGDKSAPPL
ncbi:MAG: transposase [Rhodanobacter sp.]